MFSFAKDGIFYQILCIEEGYNLDEESDTRRPFPLESQVVLTMGGLLWLSSFVQDKTMLQVVSVATLTRVNEANYHE
jgi:hypothetical protein